jgi:DNA-binding transcriptional LysR family regulator
MDLNHLSVFIAVAQAESFTEAARRLDVPKSTVSRAVAALEGSLRVRLFSRTTRSVALTTAGRALFDRVHPRLAALTEALHDLPELDDEPSGALRVTATADFGSEVLVEIIAGFTRRYPRVSVRMHLTTRSVDLVKEGFDAAFRFLSRRPRDSSLVARKLADLEVELFASPAYLAARGAPRTPDDLLAHEHVGLVGDGPISLLQASRVQVEVRPRLTADDGFFAREALRRGAGIGPLPVFLAQRDVLAGDLVRVLPRWKIESGGVYLLLPSGKHLPKKTVVFRDHVVQAFAARARRAA